MISENTNLSIAEEFAAKMKKDNQKQKIISAAPFVILLFLVAVMGITVKGFFTFDNFTSILNQLASPLALSLGLTFVIIMGSIDLSVEGVVGFVGSIVTLMVLNTKTDSDLGLAGMAVAVLAGMAIGFITGVIHVKSMLPSFMVTFAVSKIMSGFAVLSYKGEPAMVKEPLFQQIAQGSFIGIPVLTWIAFIIFAIAFFLERYTAFGRYVFAIGDNESIVRNTGINIDKIKILVFTWSGFCMGIAGVMGAIRIGRGEVLIGNGTLFPSITAIVVGGTSLAGGKGGVVNTLVGVLIVTVIQNGLILLGVNPYIQLAIQGIIIILAVSLSVTRGKKVITK